ncbi:hypothetical protein B0O80DRAFT_132959 [Mortierella sp. GBAus27b]|nr:hypothetical protein B0O80DRAFT_132959 [Mortierella sp. GBAus27b]
MIAIDGSGNKVETSVTADGFATSSLVEHGPEAEKKLRSAGRTILAYRMQTMAVAQGTLAKMEDMLKLEGVSLPPEPHKHIYNVSKSATSVQLKDKLVELVTSATEEQSRIDQGKQMDMAPFPLYKSANLAEEWSQLESATIFSVLCTFGICGLYTGRFDFGFFSKAFSRDVTARQGTLGTDIELQDPTPSSRLYSRMDSLVHPVASEAAPPPTGTRQGGGVGFIGPNLFEGMGFLNRR